MRLSLQVKQAVIVIPVIVTFATPRQQRAVFACPLLLHSVQICPLLAGAIIDINIIKVLSGAISTGAAIKNT